MRAFTVRPLLWPEQFLRDLRYAWRGLWRERAFAATTVLTLGSAYFPARRATRIDPSQALRADT
jgi:hypothetical protein